MGWQLGVDLGTTYTAAAVYKDSKANIFPLGHNSAAIPSVVFVKEDGEILTGDAANRRAGAEPERVARGFKRRLGDETPLFLGGAPFHPQALMAEMLKSVMTEVRKREGTDPSRIAVSHPANWGGFKKDLFKQAVSLANLDLGQVQFLTEPEAAAISYACNEKMAVGDKIAVYDLGGGTFDAAVLERSADGFEVLGKPEGIEQLGGVDFDAAVYAHVSRNVQDHLDDLDYDDQAAMTAVARLKRDCVDAKEALSSDADTSVPVLLPNHQTQVRITRREFEDACRPAIQSTLEAMHRALASANIEAADLSKVLLVGGSSRIPLVSQVVQSELGRPLAVDTHPKHAIALGAAYKAGSAKLLLSKEAIDTPRAQTDSSSVDPEPLLSSERSGPFPASAFAGSNIADGLTDNTEVGPVSDNSEEVPSQDPSGTPPAASPPKSVPNAARSDQASAQASHMQQAPTNQMNELDPTAVNRTESNWATPVKGASQDRTEPYPLPRQQSSSSADPRSFQPASTGRNKEDAQPKNGGLRAALVGVVAVGTIAIGGAAYAGGVFDGDPEETTETETSTLEEPSEPTDTAETVNEPAEETETVTEQTTNSEEATQGDQNNDDEVTVDETTTTAPTTTTASTTTTPPTTVTVEPTAVPVEE